MFSIPVQEKAVFGIESFETVMATYAELQASEDKQDKEDLQRLERYMAQARSLVKAYVVLEPETKSDEDLLESLKQSVAGSASGDAEKKLISWCGIAKPMVAKPKCSPTCACLPSGIVEATSKDF